MMINCSHDSTMQDGHETIDRLRGHSTDREMGE